MDWYIEVLRKYANFTGRARRKEYWLFSLFNTLFTIIIMILDHRLNTYISDGNGLLSCLYSLFIFIPSLAVLVRRLHDIGKSGWWFLISLVPIFGVFYLLYLLTIASDPEDNQYGIHSKYEKEIDHKSYEITSVLLIFLFLACGIYAILDLTTHFF
ncbi:DUF805 domain-containing protein [Aquimarina sediminis]|uniref:DUF805 domain-containing protein n=1 Tax=Aquimarina sediminis TaxID=2070536 RepID=UPI000CA057FB|nr:DUF805 domain-containing protein [Aquimarina sediminis]